MTDIVAKNAQMESPDSKASFLAAIARIEAVPSGETLIETIPEADWCNVDLLSNWKIEAGSDITGSSEELDACDKPTMRVA